MLEFRHGCQHFFVQVWLAFPVQRRPAGPRNRKLPRCNNGDFREVLVGELVALAVTVRPQQGLEHRGDDLVPFLARHVAVEIPLLRSGCCSFRQLVHRLLLHP